METSVIRGNELTAEHARVWSGLQVGNAQLESPFFRPEFTIAMSQAVSNVCVAILHRPDGEIGGFFPFQLVRPGFGKNLEMCDYHGVISSATFQCDARKLIDACGLRVWEFDHLVLGNPTFRRFFFYTADSPIIDVAQGYEAYKASLSAEGKRHLAKAATCTRKVQREVGPLIFVANSADSEAMQAMHRWRADKYGPLPAWAHQVMEVIRTTHSPAFEGVLSTLHAGDRLIAVHFGMRSRGVLHWWFPAYDPEMRSYAPGILLLLGMVERSQALGITKIDLGKGLQDYKRRFKTGSNTVATGSVDLLSFSTLPRVIRHGCGRYVRRTPLLLTLARWAKHLRVRARSALS